MRTLFTLMVALYSGTSVAANAERLCLRIGDVKEPVCAVSMNAFESNGQDFDGRLVFVTGYFAYADIPMLFGTKDSFLSSYVADGVAITMPKQVELASKLYGLDHTFIQVRVGIARSRSIPRDISRTARLAVSTILCR